MSITIEDTTAEAFYAAFKQLPLSEVERLKQLIAAEKAETAEDEEGAWHQAAARSAARFFQEEDGE